MTEQLEMEIEIDEIEASIVRIEVQHNDPQDVLVKSTIQDFEAGCDEKGLALTVIEDSQHSEYITVAYYAKDDELIDEKILPYFVDLDVSIQEMVLEDLSK